MANRIFQGVVHQMKDAIDRTVGVIDETGTIIACSELSVIGESIDGSQKVFESSECVKVGARTFKTLGSRLGAEYAAFVEGDDFEARKLAGLVSRQGYTLIPIKVYLKDGRMKLELGLCRGKHLHDKRDAAAERDAKREMDRAIRQRG